MELPKASVEAEPSERGISVNEYVLGGIVITPLMSQQVPVSKCILFVNVSSACVCASVTQYRG